MPDVLPRRVARFPQSSELGGGGHAPRCDPLGATTAGLALRPAASTDNRRPIRECAAAALAALAAGAEERNPLFLRGVAARISLPRAESDDSEAFLRTGMRCGPLLDFLYWWN